jgi:hypothetical protein
MVAVKGIEVQPHRAFEGLEKGRWFEMLQNQQRIRSDK